MTIAASSSPHGSMRLSARDEESLALVHGQQNRVISVPGGLSAAVLERAHPVHRNPARLRANTSAQTQSHRFRTGNMTDPVFGSIHNPSPTFKERL